jgi:hypothetical protein
MRHKILAIVGVSATLALTGCGSSSETVTPAATEAGDATPVSAPSAAPVVKNTPSPSPSLDVKKSVRGNLLMQGGDIGTISDRSTNKVGTKFTVNAITPGACDQPYSRPAENGQIVFIDITVETTPELAESSFPKFDISGHDFKYIAANGTTFNGSLSTVATYSCIADSATFPSGGMGPAEKVTAKVVLDLPSDHGILVLKSGISGGFEYSF